jgi:hypothetical protein
MVHWVEEIAGSNVRIVCHMSPAAPVDRSPLTYVVQKQGESERGPFATFDAAIRVALDAATQANARHRGA